MLLTVLDVSCLKVGLYLLNKMVTKQGCHCTMFVYNLLLSASLCQASKCEISLFLVQHYVRNSFSLDVNIGDIYADIFQTSQD